jgi:ketosteroid isomerase-like protein
MRRFHCGGARTAVFAAALFLLLSGACWISPPVLAAEKLSTEQVVQLQRTWLDHLVAGRWSQATDMMSADMLWIHPTGRVDGRQSRMDALVKGPQLAWASIDTKDIRAEGFMDSAVVTSETTWTSANLSAGETKPRVLHLRLTTVWVNQGGTWRVVRFQCTTIPPAAA